MTGLDAEAVEGQPDELAALKRAVVGHEFLLRALLTHLAMTEPGAFASIIEGVRQSQRHAAGGGAGELTRDVADQLERLLAAVRM